MTRIQFIVTLLLISCLNNVTYCKTSESCDDVYMKLKTEIDFLRQENEGKFLRTEAITADLRERIAKQEQTIHTQQEEINRLGGNLLYSETYGDDISYKQKRQVQQKSAFTYSNSVDLDGLGDDHTIKFDRRLTDINGDYDTSTGIFRAPVAGYYGFILDARALPGRHCWIDIVKNGNAIATDYMEAPSGQEDSETAFAIVQLTNGDQVWVRSKGHNHCGIDDLSNFSGFILYQDL